MVSHLNVEADVLVDYMKRPVQSNMSFDQVHQVKNTACCLILATLVLVIDIFPWVVCSVDSYLGLGSLGIVARTLLLVLYVLHCGMPGDVLEMGMLSPHRAVRKNDFLINL